MAYATVEQRLEEIMRQRGFTSQPAFSRSLGHSSSWYFTFVYRRAKNSRLTYSTVCSIAEKLGLIPALIHKIDAGSTPLFGEGESHFRKPVNYGYLRFAYIGDVLLAERRSKGLLQRGLARKVNLAPQIINQCESYRYVPHRDRLETICKAMDLEVEWLAEPIK
ncbi:MAG TPA: helix-turn-helix transcriptional regulator [Nanoarchaeota archaeon]|nr:helix-turn-helix transcriptional regulator [Nanoarchaeota archaeon]